MKEGWRWFGPFDGITLEQIAQTGATDIVTALHEIPFGEVWPDEAIAARCAAVSSAGLGLTWSVAESLQVPDELRRGEGDLPRLFGNYRQSLANLAKHGVRTVCYNFMPLLGWTRTDLDAPVRGGATALRFSETKMAAFEICMLRRPRAEDDYSPQVCEAGRAWHAAATPEEREKLLHSIMNGLPGAFRRYDVEGLRAELARWAGFGPDDLRASFSRFLAEVVPTAEELGVRLCAHPDDPPRPLLGLPRIVSTGDDLAWIAEQQPSLANGFNFCAGSLGANPRNDVPELFRQVADRVHFLHLRSVRVDADGSFEEDAHLAGRSRLIDVLAAALDEEARRRNEGRADWEIPFRPDHGQSIGADLTTASHHPGYPYVGRLRGLAELRGALAALQHRS